MIDPSEVELVAQRLATTLHNERGTYDTLREYLKGERGLVKLPAGANQELKDLRKRSVKNILSTVVDTYTNDITVTGYQHPDSTDNHGSWAVWNDLDFPSKQKAVTRSTVTYGVAYVSILPGSVRVGTPRFMTAEYAQNRDRFPKYSLDTWIDSDDQKHGMLVDDVNYYIVHYGPALSNRPESVEGPFRHGTRLDGEAVCPTVRFLNTETGDDDDMIQGDLEGLITDQEAVNTVNFLRLVAAKYGAAPQKAIAGFSPPSPEAAEALEHGADNVWFFDDENVKFHEYSAADPENYSKVLREMLSHVAMTAGLNPTSIGSSDMVNISADALEMVDRTHKAHVRSKQAVLSGSWKLVLRILGSMAGLEDDPSSEVLYASVDAPSIAAVGDLLSKAGPVGIPIQHLVSLIPGISPQTVRSIKREMDSSALFDPDAIFAQAARDAGVDVDDR